ncbi:3-keto-steroid reductase [Hypsibius exemplaris]|uniref:3-keto-steroid reductase n=1 Tax=Hypsibius exemplaris TaxID=2072580 RepID=A0A1W0WW30_HYPEX|nr:3-keto-steroid reductase [Hypsibius exemplaris]
MDVADQKVALITGATSGIGLGLIEKLLKDRRNLHVCITGRNPEKLAGVLSTIKRRFPEAAVSSVVLDVSDARSVLHAVEEIRKKFHRLDFLFLNAGMMPSSRMMWLNAIKGLFNGKIIHMFLTGEGMLDIAVDKKTRDGISETFATNVFGHYLLVTELEDLLGGFGADYTQIIWTSSGSALRSAFDSSDITHLKGKQAYGSSKYCMDALSLTINEEWNCRGIYSHVVCPGTVLSSMTFAILPSWFWYLLLPLFFLLRIIVRSFTLTLDAGTSGLVWLTKQAPDSLDYHQKIFTRATWFGTYLDFKKIDVDEATKELVHDQLQLLRKRVLQKIRG